MDPWKDEKTSCTLQESETNVYTVSSAGTYTFGRLHFTQTTLGGALNEITSTYALYTRKTTLQRSGLFVVGMIQTEFHVSIKGEEGFLLIQTEFYVCIKCEEGQRPATRENAATLNKWGATEVRCALNCLPSSNGGSTHRFLDFV